VSAPTVHPAHPVILRAARDLGCGRRNTLRCATVGALALLLAAPAVLRAQGAPAPAPNTAAATPAPAPAFDPKPVAGRPALRAWTGDRREFAVGDILTVFVDDYTISTAVKDDINAQRRNQIRTKY